jgi:hypothetical protein
VTTVKQWVHLDEGHWKFSVWGGERMVSSKRNLMMWKQSVMNVCHH